MSEAKRADRAARGGLDWSWSLDGNGCEFEVQNDVVDLLNDRVAIVALLEVEPHVLGTVDLDCAAINAEPESFARRSAVEVNQRDPQLEVAGQEVALHEANVDGTDRERSPGWQSSDQLNVGPD